MAIIFARKVGNSTHLCIPAVTARKNKIKHGDAFKLEQDVMLPDNYLLKKVDGSD